MICTGGTWYRNQGPLSLVLDRNCATKTVSRSNGTRYDTRYLAKVQVHTYLCIRWAQGISRTILRKVQRRFFADKYIFYKNSSGSFLAVREVLPRRLGVAGKDEKSIT